MAKREGNEIKRKSEERKAKEGEEERKEERRAKEGPSLQEKKKGSKSKQSLSKVFNNCRSFSYNT